MAHQESVIARVPSQSKFSIERFAGADEWFKRFLGELNVYTESVALALAKNLTFSENIASRIVTLPITGKATADLNTATVSVDAGRVPIGVHPLQVVQTNDSYAANTSPVFVDWIYRNGAVSIKAITGLTSGTLYNITLLVLYR